MNPCPTCGHAHLGGFGINMCACSDCFTLFGPVPYEQMAPEYQQEYRQLVAKQQQESAP